MFYCGAFVGGPGYGGMSLDAIKQDQLTMVTSIACTRENTRPIPSAIDDLQELQTARTHFPAARRPDTDPKRSLSRDAVPTFDT